MQIGRYEVQAELGRGAFTRVFRAWDPHTKLQVAIRVPVEPSEKELFQSFQREAAVLKALKHKHIVGIHEWGEHQGTPFIAVEYLKGETLRRVIVNRTPLTVFEKMEILSQVADALDCTHRAGTVHLDLRPDNILLLPDGQAKVLDFGSVELTEQCAARLAREGYLSASILYATPEQLNSSEVTDVLSDVFVYGVLCYELLTGKHPFEAEHEEAVIARIVGGDPAPVRTLAPECPPALGRMLKRALEKEPGLRFQTLAEVRAELDPLLDVVRREGEDEDLGSVEPVTTSRRPVERGQPPAEPPVQRAPSPEPLTSASPAGSGRRRRLLWAVPALTLIAAAGVVVPRFAHKKSRVPIPSTTVVSAAATLNESAVAPSAAPEQTASQPPTPAPEEPRPSAFGAPEQPAPAPDVRQAAVAEQTATEEPAEEKKEEKVAKDGPRPLDPSILLRPIRRAPNPALKIEDLAAPSLPASPAPGVPSALLTPAAARVALPPPAPVVEQVRVGGNFQEAKLISGPQPQVPPLARERRVYGVVKLEATISKEGTVKRVTVLSGHPFLAAAAKEAALLRRYQPAMLNGQPMEIKIPIQMVFQPSP